MKIKFLLVVLVAISSVGAIGFAFAYAATAASDLAPKEARKLIAKMAGIDLASNEVRVKDVSVSGDSAVVVAQVETAFRFEKRGDQWRVAEIRTGNNKWEDLDMLVKALNSEKSARAKAELDSVATALESFRRDQGAFLESNSEATLIDHLNPTYLRRVVRFDPWHQPYQYEGTRTSYVLRSLGPDGKPDTADDLVLSK
jgi:hypothetical protein